MKKVEEIRHVILARDSGKSHEEEIVVLSNTDRSMPALHVVMTYFFRPTPHFHVPSRTENEFMSSKVLRASLAKALATYWAAGGKLKDLGGGRMAISRNGEGVEFLEVKFEDSFDEVLGGYDPKPELIFLHPSSLPCMGPMGPISKVPLLQVQVSRFKCGAVCLAVGMHHAVCDGKGMTDFIRAWADIASGNEAPTTALIDRSVLKARTPPIVSLPFTEFRTLNPLDLPVCPPKMTTKMFEFSAAFIQRLQEEANRGRRELFYSAFDAFAAYIWRSITAARKINSEKEIRLGFAVDGRKRYVPPLPANYFGNAVAMTSAKTTAGTLLSSSLSSAASLVHDAKVQVDDRYMKSTTDWLELQPDLQRLSPVTNVMSGLDVVITSWSRYSSYETDFGWGKPTFFGTPSPVPDGLVMVLPGQLGSGAWNVLVGLVDEHMRNLLASHFVQ